MRHTYSLPFEAGIGLRLTRRAVKMGVEFRFCFEFINNPREVGRI